MHKGKLVKARVICIMIVEKTLDTGDALDIRKAMTPRFSDMGEVRERLALLIKRRGDDTESRVIR
jgi:hypothetical protein